MKKPKAPLIIVGIAALTAVILLTAGDSNHPSAVGGHGSAQIIDHSGQGASNFAPDFTLEKLGGGNVTLSSYRGQKAVILDFFATWCPNCRRDIPHESALYNQYKNQVEVIGVNLQENPATVSQFANQFRVPFPIALDPSSQASGQYGVQYTNFHVLVAKDGKLIKTIPGDIGKSDFEQLAGNS